MSLAPQAFGAGSPVNVQSVINNLQNLVLAVNNLTSQLASQFGANSVYTFATLPIVAVPSRAFIADSSVAASGNFGAIAAGGGANIVPVYFDETNWKIG